MDESDALTIQDPPPQDTLMDGPPQQEQTPPPSPTMADARILDDERIRAEKASAMRTETALLAKVLPDKRGDSEELKALRDKAITTGDPQMFMDRAVSWRATAAMLGVTPDSLDDRNYELYKKQVASQMKVPVPSTDGGYRDLLSGYFQKEHAKATAFESIPAMVITNLDQEGGAGKSMGILERFNEWKALNADAVAGVPDAEALSQFSKSYQSARSEMNGQFTPLARQIVDAFGNKPMGEQEVSEVKNALTQTASADPILNALGVTSRENFVKDEDKATPIIEQLTSLSAEDRKKVYQLAGALERARNPQQTGFLASLYSMGQAFSRAADSSVIPDEQDPQKALRNRIGLELKDAARNGVNPMLYSDKVGYESTGTFLTKVGQGVAGAGKYVAASALAGPEVGLAYMGANIVAEQQNRLLLQNPDMTPNEALAYGAAIAAPQTALMSISLRGMTGAFPSIERAIEKVASGAVSKYALNTAISGVGFTGAGVVEAIGDSVIHEIDPEWNKGSEIGRDLHRVFVNAPQDFAMAAVFSLFHAGKPVDREALNRIAEDPANLVKQGLSQEAAERVAATPPETRPETLASELSSVTPEQKEQGIQLSEREAQKAQALAQDPAAPKVETLPDGKIAVISPDEKGNHQPVFVTDDPQAAHQALTLALDEHAAKRAETEPTNDWTTATEEVSSGKVEMPAGEGNIPTGEAESLPDETLPDSQSTNPKKTISRQWGDFPKGTEVEVIGERSKDPLDTNLLVRFPDGKEEKFPIDWLKTPKGQMTAPKESLPQLVKRLGRDGVNDLLAEWNDAELSPDGKFILGVVDPRSSMKLERIPVREFIDWVREKQANESNVNSDRIKNFSLENPDIQAYLDLVHVPQEKREQAGEALQQVARASEESYPQQGVSDAAGVDRDELRQIREEQAAAYRGLLKGDVEAVKNAIENGIPLSKLIEAYAKGDPVPFSIQGAIINSPADLAAHNLAHRTPFFESLKVAVLDNSNQVIHSELVSIGSLNESIAHPREIMRAVERGKQVAGDLGRKIQGWMLMHNHPSGDPTPSEADRRLTRRLDEVAKMMQSPLLDHVITNGETYFSFNQEGLHGENVKRNPKLRPKLQTIPKSDDLKEGTMADWEATPASEALKVDRAGVVSMIRATLQTADPGMIHVLNLNTRHGIISVDRHPLDVTPGEILKQSSKHGTYAIALSLPDASPEGVPMGAEEAIASGAWRPFVRKMTEAGTLYQLPLVDAVARDYSWRESGLLEEPGQYKVSDGVVQENPNKIPPPLTLKDKAKIAAGKIASAVRDLPADSDFKREVLKWSARSQGSTNEIERVQKSIEKSVPDAAKRDGITNWIEAGGDKNLLRERAAATVDAKLKAGYEAALNLTPEELAVAQKVKQAFNILEGRAKKYGIDMGHRENYVPHVFEQEPQPPSGTSPKRLSEFFKFSQTRVFDSYFEGEQVTDKDGNPAPYKAQTKDIAKLLGLYMNDMNNAINSRRFVADLSKGKASDGRPLVSPRGGGRATAGEHGEQETHLVYPDLAKEGHEDYKIVDQPALHDWTFAGKDDLGANIMVKGDLAVHPEVESHLKNALGTSAITKWLQAKSENPFLNGGKWVADKFIKGQGIVKGTMLSFSPFHQVQEGIHALGHRVNPFTDIPKIDLRDPKQADAAAHGLMIAHDRLSQSLFMEGVGSNNSNLITMGLRKIGWGLTTEAADRVDAYQHWLFSRYIPGLKLKTYEHILERNMERYKDDLASGTASEWQVKVLSAKQSNAAYGHLNYTEMGHNPTIRHAMQIALLAPDFLEARSRFVGQSLKALAGAKVGSEQLQALAFLAATQFVAATIQKVLTNDDAEFDHPFEMRFGNKYYGMRSVPEDIYKLFGNPAGFIGGRISPIFGRFLQEGIFGVNYRGERTSAGDAITDIMAGIVPLPMQTLTRQWTTGGKVNPISPLEQILSATGIQVHRYSPITKVYPLAHDWVKKNYPEDEQKGTYPVSKYQQLRYALEDNDTEAAKKEIDRLVEGGMKKADIGKGFKSSVNHPFTGSKDHDHEFYKSLDEDDKQRFDAAVERRKEILRRFQSLGD